MNIMCFLVLLELDSVGTTLKTQQGLFTWNIEWPQRKNSPER